MPLSSDRYGLGVGADVAFCSPLSVQFAVVHKVTFFAVLFDYCPRINRGCCERFVVFSFTLLSFVQSNFDSFFLLRSSLLRSCE